MIFRTWPRSRFLRQARDLVKFIRNLRAPTAEMKEEVRKIYQEAEQADREILHQEVLPNEESLQRLIPETGWKKFEPGRTATAPAKPGQVWRLWPGGGGLHSRS